MLKIAWSEIYAHPLPHNHRFPMLKYNLLPQQLLHEGTVEPVNFFVPQPLPLKYILLAHTKYYWLKLKNGTLNRHEVRKTGFPYSSQLIEREVTIMGGTVQAALFALQYGIAFNIAGGTHHAFSDRGEGFCLLNDLALAANYLLYYKLARRIAIIDLDVHQGNGTAEIFKDSASVYTFSMHGHKNYPLQKESSSMDVDLEDGTGDAEYLAKLEFHLRHTIAPYKPDFILYQSGVDVLSTDKLGRMALTLAGCRSRDELVLEFAHQRNVPIACAMGGGYSADVRLIVEAHANTYRLAQHIFFN